jgi:hypothetical protein
MVLQRQLRLHLIPLQRCAEVEQGQWLTQQFGRLVSRYDLAGEPFQSLRYLNAACYQIALHFPPGDLLERRYR